MRNFCDTTRLSRLRLFSPGAAARQCTPVWQARACYSLATRIKKNYGLSIHLSSLLHGQADTVLVHCKLQHFTNSLFLLTLANFLFLLTLPNFHFVLTLPNFLVLLTLPNFLFFFSLPNFLFLLTLPNSLFLLTLPNFLILLNQPNLLFVDST